MPKEFFQMIPTVQYDVDGDGTSKVAIDILRRVKTRVESLLDSAVFYNYPIQDGDTAEIIADKYYGSAKYHWVVMLMNNFSDHTYDFTLNDFNFESYIKDKYGSIERSKSVSKNLTSFAISSASGVGPEWWSTDMKANISKATPLGANPHYAGDGPTSNDPILRSGTIPGGHSTAIYIKSEKGNDPWGPNINVGDTLNLFIPGEWYLSMNTEPAVSFVPEDYKKISYAFSAKIIGKSERIGYKEGVPDSYGTHSYFYVNTNMNSNTYVPFTWDLGTTSILLTPRPAEFVFIQTNIHHFELDVIDVGSGDTLAENLLISQDQYVNTSIGVGGTKKFVSNYDYEAEQNENKRIIYLLKKEYLQEFIDEYQSLISLGE